jgi:hypothetical protein
VQEASYYDIEKFYGTFYRAAAATRRRSRKWKEKFEKP